MAFSATLDALVEGHGGIRLDDASTGSSEVMFSSVGEAIDFALAARAELAVAGIPIRIAVPTGDLGVEEVKWGAARLIERAGSYASRWSTIEKSFCREQRSLSKIRPPEQRSAR